MYRQLVLLSLIGVAAAASAFAQPLRFERITVDNGLSGNWIRGVVQDADGYLWIGTNTGLNRYDGYAFTAFQFDLSDPASLSDNSVTALLIDRDGQLWVGTAQGLNRFEPGTETFERYLHDPEDPHSLSDDSISALCQDRSGHIWIGTSRGLNRLDRSSGRFTSFRHVPTDPQSLASDVVTALLEDHTGAFWIGTMGGGLNVMDRRRATFRAYRHDPQDPASLGSDVISALTETRDGTLWVGTLPHAHIDGAVQPGEEFRTGGMSQFERATGTFRVFRALPDLPGSFWNFVSDILEDSGGNLWVTSRLGGDDAGLFWMDRERGTFVQHGYDPSNPASLSWNYATALFEDRSGILWVGTSRGLNKLDRGRQRFGHIKQHPTDPYHLHDNVYAIYEDRQGRLWLGLDGPGLLRMEGTTGDVRLFSADGRPGQLGASGVYAITEGKDGTIWISTRTDGLRAFDPRTGSFTVFRHESDNPNSLSSSYVTSLHVARDGTIWVGTATGLTALDQQGRVAKRYYHDPADDLSLSSNQISALLEDREGFLWIGTNIPQYFGQAGAAGANRLDPASGTVVRYRHDPHDPGSLSNNGVTIIHQDATGEIWIGTEHGLNRLDEAGGRFKHYLERDGLPSASIAGILEDDSGHLWISTLGGISRFDPQTETFRNFDRTDGIQDKRFNLRSYFKSSRGEMFFGGVSGVNHFFPHEIEDNSDVPPVVLTSFRSRYDMVQARHGVARHGELELPYRENGFEVEFAALSFRAPEKNQYAYKLEGFDREWIYSGTRRYASYTNLSPGRYTFRVRGSNNDGVWNEEGAAIRVRVLPPWWLTWWAYAFYGLALAGGVFGVDRYQRRRVIARERERARERELEQAREIERAYEELKRTQAQLVQQEKLASLGALTAGIAHEIKNPLNFVNNFGQLSGELIEELHEALGKVPPDQATISQLLADLRTNTAKIEEHGKRADSIVKSMLQHSRGGTGKRETVNLNDLVEEYVTLAYHGRRAQQPGFNVTIERDLAPDAGQVDLVPQDLGRVVLNLVGNAFDAVDDRAAAGDAEGYVPTVRVSTRRSRGQIEVRVQDNGPGISAEVTEKIFEPFFTTKAAGHGTGLGLSMSHEIVQAHSGAIRVESQEGRGTTFIVSIPDAPSPRPTDSTRT